MRNSSHTSLQGEELSARDQSTLVDLPDFKFHMNHSPCNEQRPPKLLVMVHSAPKNYEKRLQIRNTWGSVLEGTLIFVLGEVDNEALQSNLEQENRQFGDLVQGSFLDAYRNLTYKHTTTLKWVQYFCPYAHYILKTDDDTFINTPALLQVLSKEDCQLKNLIMCRLWVKVPVQRQGYKWTVSRTEFEPDVFPNYCSGTAILYSSDVAHMLYREAQKAPYFWVDDVHVTGVLAGKLNLSHFGVEGQILPVRLSYNETIICRNHPSHLSFLFSRHNMSAKAMTMLWHYVQKCS
ncbi:hypothetical protein C0J52_26270 [Blattella germanica]|nr:hypothetical protein C0J52_26270 [Blattella germanica]